MYGDKTLATTSLQGTCAHEYTHLTHGLSSYIKRGSQGNVRMSICSHMVMERRLRFFGHIACSAPNEDHHRAVAAAILNLPPDWKRPREDLVTYVAGSEPSSLIWNYWTSVLPKRGKGIFSRTLAFRL